MARFRFRLATLQRLREAARDEKRAQLADAYRAAQILEGQLAEVDREIAALRATSGEAIQAGQIDVDRLLQGHRYEIILRSQRKGIELQQQQVAAEIDRRRLALVEADRQVRVLEKLREKKLQEFDQAEMRRDQKLMDELAARAKPALGEVLP